MKDVTKTIWSEGKCLTAYRLEMEQSVKIHNCTTKPEYSGNKWEIKDNVNIINKESKLALNAYTESRTKAYSSSQGWSLTNSTEPVVTPVFSYKGTCLQASGNISVQVSFCSDKGVQQWALPPKYVD
ncbi:abrin-a-like [Apium graveolens]|uniref:abrin-a-like n=1 Tax=Apium graveolens TaxID=4045 RepID=UPI003D79D3C2